jgi:hypothetical protein
MNDQSVESESWQDQYAAYLYEKEQTELQIPVLSSELKPLSNTSSSSLQIREYDDQKVTNERTEAARERVKVESSNKVLNKSDEATWEEQYAAYLAEK